MFQLVALLAVLTVVAANPITFWGNGLARPLATSWSSPIATGIATPWVSPYAPVGVPNYRGPLSLAPDQPANILAADGRPLDTLSVNLDRAVHYTARALDGNGRRLQKRSVLVAPIATTHLPATNFAAANLAAVTYGAGTWAAGPVAATPLATSLLTLGRSWVGPAPIAPAAIAVGAPIGL